MKLKLKGNGTALGTRICSENDEELLGVEAFTLSIDATFLMPILKITMSTVLFDLPSLLCIGSNPRPNRPGFYVKLIGDGTGQGTRLIDADTLEEIDGLTNIKWFVHTKIGIATADLEINDFIFDVQSQNGSSSSVLLNNSGVVCPPPTGVTVSSSSSVPPDPTLFDDIDKIDLDLDDTIQCSHEWVNASFFGLKYVCKKCNIDKPKS